MNDSSFPLLLDCRDAINYYQRNQPASDAIIAYIVGICRKEGLTNKFLRESLSIDKVYTLTHYARVGKALNEEELMLWHKNQHKISFGHMRAIAKLPVNERDKLIRSALARPIPVSEFERIARGEVAQQDTDIKRYQELMGDAIGHPVQIKFNRATGSGRLSLDFFNLDELDKFAELLGFNPRDYF